MINDLYTLKQNLNRAGILYCYCGPITQELTEAIGNILREKNTLTDDATPAMAMRIFSVFVEMVQNISLYATPDSAAKGDAAKSGIIVVGKEDGMFFVLCGNRMRSDSCSRIEELLQRLQKMDRDALKDFYKERRRQPPDPESKGAGLGFIEIARKTNGFSYAFDKIDGNNTFFSLKAML